MTLPSLQDITLFLASAKGTGFPPPLDFSHKHTDVSAQFSIPAKEDELKNKDMKNSKIIFFNGILGMHYYYS